MRRLAYIIIILTTLWILSLNNKSLPTIKLPRAMQHNTFGELPVVEIWDDGDFFVENGDEDYSTLIQKGGKTWIRF